VQELQEFFSLLLSYTWSQSCPPANIFAVSVFVYQSMTVRCMAEFLLMLSLHLCVLQNFLEEGPLHSIHWYRVVLDEAHTIKAFRSNASQAVFQLTADRRWCLTGTPIQVHSHKQAILNSSTQLEGELSSAMSDIRADSMRILGNNKLSLYYVCCSLS
jgi:superfamily II DNA or RNA helicase